MRTNSETEQQSRVFRLPKRNTNTTKKNVDYPPAVIIPSVDEIYEEVMVDGERVGQNRIIRYVQGEKSIYADEQSKGADKRVGEVPPLINGHLIVDYREVNLIKFLEKCNWNGANKARKKGSSVLFIEVKKGQDAAKFIDMDRAETKLKNSIYDMTVSELEGACMVLGVHGWEDKVTDELRRDLIVMAKKDPKFFNETINSDSAKIQYHIIKGQAEGILEVNENDNTVRWAASRRMITQAPLSENLVKFCVTYFASSKGETEYAHLLELLYPDKEEYKQAPEEPKKDTPPAAPSAAESKQTSPPAAPPAMDNDDSVAGLSTEDLIEKAVECGVIVRAGQWHSFGETKFQGKVKTFNAVNGDEDLKKAIIRDVDFALAKS